MDAIKMQNINMLIYQNYIDLYYDTWLIKQLGIC